MCIINEDNLQNSKIKSKFNKKDILNQSILSKKNQNLNTRTDASFSINNQKISGYSTIGKELTECSSIVGNQSKISNKTFMNPNKLNINLSKELNPENIDDFYLNKEKAFEFLEDIDTLSDSEINENNDKNINIPKLDFSEILREYQNTRVKVRIVRGLSSSCSNSYS